MVYTIELIGGDEPSAVFNRVSDNHQIRVVFPTAGSAGRRLELFSDEITERFFVIKSFGKFTGLFTSSRNGYYYPEDEEGMPVAIKSSKSILLGPDVIVSTLLDTPDSLTPIITERLNLISQQLGADIEFIPLTISAVCL